MTRNEELAAAFYAAADGVMEPFGLAQSQQRITHSGVSVISGPHNTVALDQARSTAAVMRAIGAVYARTATVGAALDYDKRGDA